MNDNNIQPLAVNPEQAAELLSVSKALFYRLLKSGRLPLRPMRLTEKKTLFSVREIQAFVDSGMPRNFSYEERMPAR